MARIVSSLFPRADDDNRRVPVDTVLADLFHELDAVHDGHVDIKEDESKSLSFDRISRLQDRSWHPQVCNP